MSNPTSLYPQTAQVKRASNMILFILTVLSVYSHFMVDEKFERTAPALVFFFMLSCRLVVEFQNERKLLKKAQQQAEEDQRLLDGDATAGNSTAAAVGGGKVDKIDWGGLLNMVCVKFTMRWNFCTDYWENEEIFVEKKKLLFIFFSREQ